MFRDLGGEKRDDGGRSDESKTGSNDAGRIKRRTTIAFGAGATVRERQGFSWLLLYLLVS